MACLINILESDPGAIKMNISITKWLSQVLSDPFCLSYLSLQVLIFIIFCFHVLLPIFNRTGQFNTVITGMNKNAPKKKSSGEIRLFILEIIKKTIPWGYDRSQEYKEAWSNSRIGDDEKASSPIRIKDFLTPEIVLDRIRNQRLANALPGIFVSVGIFGTFLGLVLGLAEVNPEDVAGMAKGVKSLMAGLSLAFSSSLLGILFSVLFSFVYKVQITRLEDTFLSFDESVCKCFPYHSSEKFSAQYLETQIDIKHSMQTLATDIVTKLGPKIGEAIGAELNPLRYDFSLLLENLQKNNSDTSKGLVELFDTKFREVFKELSVIVKETTEAQSDIKDQMIHFAESLQKHFKGQAELIEKTSRAGQILGDSLESLESISGQLKSSADHVVTAATLLGESAEKAKDGHEILRDTMEKQIEVLTKTREDLTASWQNITDNTEGVVELMRLTIGELQEGVGTNLLKALESFDGKVAEVAERFSGTLFETSEIIEELPALLADLNETFQTIGSEISAQKDIIKELNSTTKDMVAPNINEAAKAANVLKDSSQMLLTIKTDLHNLFAKVIPSLQSNFKLLGPEGPMINQLNQLNKNLNGSDSLKNKEDSEYNGHIKEISTHLEHIKNIIKTNRVPENDNGDGKLLNSIIAIDDKIDSISKFFNETSFSTLQESQIANIKMAQTFDELKNTLTNETLSQPVKKGLLGRMWNK